MVVKVIWMLEKWCGQYFSDGIEIITTVLKVFGDGIVIVVGSCRDAPLCHRYLSFFIAWMDWEQIRFQE